MEGMSNDRRRRSFSTERSSRGCCQTDLAAVRSQARTTSELAELLFARDSGWCRTTVRNWRHVGSSSRIKHA